MDAGRLLQRLDDMRKQSLLDLAPVRRSASIAHKQVADHALALLVNEKRVAEHAAALNGRIARQNLRVQISHNHLGRTGVVPGEQPRPHPDLILQQRPKVSRRKVSEIEDFHGESRLQCRV